jgi:hypothetical protein
MAKATVVRQAEPAAMTARSNWKKVSILLLGALATLIMIFALALMKPALQ